MMAETKDGVTTAETTPVDEAHSSSASEEVTAESLAVHGNGVGHDESPGARTHEEEDAESAEGEPDASAEEGFEVVSEAVDEPPTGEGPRAEPEPARLAASAAPGGVEPAADEAEAEPIEGGVDPTEAASEPASEGGAEPAGAPPAAVRASEGAGDEGSERASADPDVPDPEVHEPELQMGAPELPKDEMSFAEMFELAEKQSKEKREKLKEALGGNIRVGQVIFAKVVGFTADSVFVDVGAKAEGVIAKSELTDEESGELELKEGDKIEARIRKIDGGTVILTKVLPHQSLKNREELREAHRTGIPVEARVTGQNKGGFDVEINGIRAFCPASQIDLRPSKDAVYVGNKYPFKITEFKDGGKNIVVSRRQVLVEENQRKAKETLEKLEVGAIVDGVVTSVRDYGAFVDIGGVEGLVHMSEISHGHVGKPSERLKTGYLVKAQVLKIEEGKKSGEKKISLSMKALEEDPWERAQMEIREGMKVRGTVARLQSFGAFVEILPGVDGLVHVSNMKLGERVTNPKDVVKVGEEVEATVISTDWDKRRIGLSIAKTPAELANELRKGAVLEGTIDKIESFGLFVKLPNDARGLVPAVETGTQRGADLAKEFKVGDKTKVTILDVDAKSGKVRLSIRAARQAEERAEFEGFLGTSKEKGKGLGTLGDLFRERLSELRQK